MIAEAVALYAADVGEFIAGRNQLAKQLKADGRADDAAAVAALRRPKLSEHALNLVAHHDAATMQRLTDAIAAASAAQASAIGGDAGALRAATNDLRVAVRTATDAAVRQLNETGASGKGQRDEIGELIRQFVSAGSTAQLAAGVVGAAPIEAGDELFANITVAGRGAAHAAPATPVDENARGSKAAKASAPAPVRAA